MRIFSSPIKYFVLQLENPTYIDWAEIPLSAPMTLTHSILPAPTQSSLQHTETERVP